MKRKMVDYKGVKVHICSNEECDFENHNIVRRTINLFVHPILKIVPKSFRSFVEGTHETSKNVIKTAKTHEAIEILYNHGYPNKLDKIPFYKKAIHKIWFSFSNPMAVRNRLKLVKRILDTNIKKILEDKSDLVLLSIASGSARAVLETIVNYDSITVKNIHIYFLDKNPYAIEYSKNLSKVILGERYDEYNLNWITDSSSKFVNYINKKIDIVEMVGLLDYFDDEQSLKMFKIIYDHMNERGFFITANILHNPEERFITDIIGWNMIYRKPQDLIRLAIESGFDSNNLGVKCEPLLIHAVINCRK